MNNLSDLYSIKHSELKHNFVKIDEKMYSEQKSSSQGLLKAKAKDVVKYAHGLK